MTQKIKFLSFCMIFVSNAAFCQYKHFINPASSFHTDSLNKKTALRPVNSLPLIPGNFYITQLGFFCKKEWKFEAATKLPLKFRIGNIQYCDWLEGKKGAGLLPVQ